MPSLYIIFHAVYCANISFLILIALLSGLVWSYLSAYLIPTKTRFIHTYNFVLLFIFTLAIVFYTMLDRSNNVYTLHLTPFHSFRDALQNRELYRSMFMNCLLFYPFGLFFGCLLMKHPLPGLAALLGLAILLSGGIEVWQYLAHAGDADIDDVLCNVFGALVGYGVAVAGIPLLPRLKALAAKLQPFFKRIFHSQ